ncbi:hypothetical protein JTB14_027861 [Gonioctena quinquepunctata]|nr:hypothetical protein JTB14_027861 [Gonioctena quinquepunctata]
MTIEQVLLCSMKSNKGLTSGRCITETVLARWTLGMIYLQNICADVEEFCNVEAPTKQHVEMRPTRISRDEADTQKLSNWFSKQPPFRNTDVIMSLSSRLVGDQKVNCHMARGIGKTALINVVGENFQNVKLKQKLKVVTLFSAVRIVDVGNKQVAVDPLTLFHRLCVLKQSDEEMQTFFNYELLLLLLLSPCMVASQGSTPQIPCGTSYLPKLQRRPLSTQSGFLQLLMLQSSTLSGLTTGCRNEWGKT